MLEEFYNIFGPELKSVTGDPRRIEEVVKRVDALVKPIEEVGNLLFCGSGEQLCSVHGQLGSICFVTKSTCGPYNVINIFDCFII